MSYCEADFQTALAKALRIHLRENAAIELKLAKGNSLPFASVLPHQYQSLLDAKHGTLYHKISDQSAGFKPFDCFMLSGSSAYVAILFYRPRMPKTAYLIDIDTFITERAASTRKSITKERAQLIATHALDI